MCKMDVTRLVGLVKMRPAIWDQKDYNYKNRDVVKLLWEEVAVELNRPLEKVRKRWKNLRDMFRNEIKKILVESGDSLPEEFVSPWTHFEDMVFLKDQIVTRKTLRNLNITGVDLDSDSEELEHVEIAVSPVTFDDEEDELRADGEAVTGAEPPVAPSLCDMIPTDYQTLDHFLKPPNHGDIIPTDYQTLDHFLKPPSHGSRKRKREPEVYYQPAPLGLVDDDYHFLLSFLPSMKQMPFQTKMWFRLKMQELLCSCVTPEPAACVAPGGHVSNCASGPATGQVKHEICQTI